MLTFIYLFVKATNLGEVSACFLVLNDDSSQMHSRNKIEAKRLTLTF